MLKAGDSYFIPAGKVHDAKGHGGATKVLDLGAGTGKLTTRLVERGLDVVAVDPIAEMLEVLSASLPDTPALLGTAEEIPLPNESVDAVLVAQAWHWVDPERAVAEVARVLRPGGRLGLLWNTPDQRLGWVRELGEIVGFAHDPLDAHSGLPAPFTDTVVQRVRWSLEPTRAAPSSAHRNRRPRRESTQREALACVRD